ncbi:NUDIX hydrolase [Chengkuizengella axinellae]|uniref:NUDIX domain-containing protein n=1 Tax=Chengkuizengella axinellae TaxID=3064388 RepID=A0ABT9IX22_9BACL|nr:NUDIX domain-containing protein [Chengkuizengella sp. 2205SS18-9]MDP5273873.1 NUDIX domain-containing protein [Chengkuizengella sp. 2205SS18-9]
MEKVELVFGEKKTDQTYITRPGAYAIIFNETKNQVMTVQSLKTGNYFLPGGGIENKETPEQCLHREALEEIGCKIELGDFLGSAGNYFYSPTYDTYYFMIGYFYMARIVEKVQESIEPDETYGWMDTSKAKQDLVHAHHRWALKKAMEI